jgi:hypothetical protein
MIFSKLIHLITKTLSIKDSGGFVSKFIAKPPTVPLKESLSAKETVSDVGLAPEPAVVFFKI